MRVVFVGASTLTVVTARLAIEKGHEVVIVELDQERIDALSGELDCGFIQGDGSFPAILEEVGPENTDFLICLTDNDQDNILASLVGQEMAFDRVITRIENPDFDTVCKQLKLEDVFNPDRQVADMLLDRVEGHKHARNATELKGDLSFFRFQVVEDTAKKLDALDLPEDAQALCVERGEQGFLIGDLEALEEGDVVTVITRKERIEELASKFQLPHQSSNNQKED